MDTNVFYVTSESRYYLIPQIQVQIHGLISFSWNMKLWLYLENVAQVKGVSLQYVFYAFWRAYWVERLTVVWLT